MITKDEKLTYFFKEFESIQDLRQKKKVAHKLIDIIVIVVCGAICGIDSWEKIELFAKQKIELFKKLLELPNGIPSHDTIERVFSWINPDELKNCFIRWINSICTLENGEIVSIDGKTCRGSRTDKKDAIHIVNVWANTNQLVLGQMKVADKSNEITAIPELLKIIDVSKCIVTIDAMGCQKEIAKEIINSKADFVLALKGNQKQLFEDAKLYLDEAIKNGFKDGADEIPYDYHETFDKKHGRTETRKYWITNKIDWLESKNEWKGLKTIGVVESTRTLKEKTSIEKRYYIASIDNDAKKFANAVRSHWGVENNLHWTLDVVFEEDRSKINKDNSPVNMSIAKKIALNLLKHEKTVTKSMSFKSLKALMDNEYLEKVILDFKIEK